MCEFLLLFELDTFASTYSRDLLPHTRGANGFRDRGHVMQFFGQATANRHRQPPSRRAPLLKTAKGKSRSSVRPVIVLNRVDPIKEHDWERLGLLLYRLQSIFSKRELNWDVLEMGLHVWTRLRLHDWSRLRNTIGNDWDSKSIFFNRFLSIFSRRDVTCSLTL